MTSVNPQKTSLLCEGKDKRVYACEEPGMCIISYKDEASAFNGLKRGFIPGKGAVDNHVSNVLMRFLSSNGIPTHFVRELSDTDTLVRRVKMFPLTVVVRNCTSGSMAQRLGMEEGIPLTPPVIEFNYKCNALDDPLVNTTHILAFGWATPEQVEQMKDLTLRSNTLLTAFLSGLGIRLADLRLEFGVDEQGNVLLADEISPDTCRFWDSTTGEKLDKDRFRRDMDGVTEAYQEVLRRFSSPSV